ncbi:276_t:CDS:1, partial [Rhizophagus irregularis]
VFHLGGSYNHEFAKACANVVFDLCFPSILILRQLLYIKLFKSYIEK